jgi:hypothetical protein
MLQSKSSFGTVMQFEAIFLRLIRYHFFLRDDKKSLEQFVVVRELEHRFFTRLVMIVLI